MVAPHVASLIELPRTPPPLVEARAACARLARTHYENFAVVSRLVPRRLRTHVRALYATCRTVDDLGDEAPNDREALLDRFEQELDAAYRGTPRHPVLVALRETIEALDLPETPFRRLIEANRIDQRQRRYETFEDLLHYCEHSADPVGRLYLALFGFRDEARGRLSDRICTALQLTNFWQDVRRDLAAGRIYIPGEDLARFGVSEADLAAPRAGPGVRALLRFEVARTRDVFREGLPLLASVRGRLRIALALFVRGGEAVLRKIEAQGYDTLRRRPSLRSTEKARLTIGALLAPARPPWTDD